MVKVGVITKVRAPQVCGMNKGWNEQANKIASFVLENTVL